jgi:cystathionine beta-synthase
MNMKIHDNILTTIGNTPLVRLNKITKEISATVLAKVETFNPGNSIKDRMALKMVEDAEKAGLLKPGRHHHRRHQWQHRDGAGDRGHHQRLQVHLHHHGQAEQGEGGCIARVRCRSDRLPNERGPRGPPLLLLGKLPLGGRDPNSWKANQYDNLSNSQAHYESTGPEIWEQTEGKITHLVVGVGTGGTICGTGRYLKEKNPNIKIFGIDTYGSVFTKLKETGDLRQERDLSLHHRRHW